MSDTTTAAVPTTFWGQIDHQLGRIRTEKPQTFSGLREILMDPAYDQITQDVNRNGARSFGPGQAFFAGSGGDDTVFDALLDAGWMVTKFIADYHYTAIHPTTRGALSYTEGDLEEITGV